MYDWLCLATSRDVIRRALTIACIVGPILIVINQGDVLFNGVEQFSWGKAVLTFLVPYMVSTYSSVCALLNKEQD